VLSYPAEPPIEAEVIPSVASQKDQKTAAAAGKAAGVKTDKVTPNVLITGLLRFGG